MKYLEFGTTSSLSLTFPLTSSAMTVYGVHVFVVRSSYLYHAWFIDVICVGVLFKLKSYNWRIPFDQVKREGYRSSLHVRHFALPRKIDWLGIRALYTSSVNVS